MMRIAAGSSVNTTYMRVMVLSPRWCGAAHAPFRRSAVGLSTLDASASLPSPSSSAVPQSSLHNPAVNRRYHDDKSHPHVIIRSSTVDDGRGYGLLARHALDKGQMVMSATALEVHTIPTSHTIQTDWNRHVTMDLPAILVNHSCQANLGIQSNDHGAYDFVALEDIPEGDEVTWDYETSEYEMAEAFSCSCGSPMCRGILQGFRGNGPVVIAAYGREHVAPYLFDRRRPKGTFVKNET